MRIMGMVHVYLEENQKSTFRELTPQRLIDLMIETVEPSETSEKLNQYPSKMTGFT